MKSARILIVEDKSVIAESIACMLENAGYDVAGIMVSGEQALEYMEHELPDVILMDIQLGGTLDGIQTVEEINRKYNIPVIYLTDFHDEVTINRAKHTRPAAYLLKPFKERDLLITIELAFYNASAGREAVPGFRDKVSDSFFPLTDRFFFKEKDTILRVDIADVLWIEAHGAYCKIQTKDRVLTVIMNMRLLSERLTHKYIVRVHRSYMVNLDKITAIKGNMLVIGDVQITMAPSYRDEVFRRLQKI